MYAPAFSLREVSFELQELDMANTRSAKKMVRKVSRLSARVSAMG